MTISAAAGAAVLPYLERPRGHLEEQYPPSYAPKALALTAASLAPVAVLDRSLAGWFNGLVVQASAAAAVAAATSGQDYHLRIEEYRGFNLDWLLPMLAAARAIPDRNFRLGTMAMLAGAWAIANHRRVDVLAQLDPAHAEGHTHHLSAAQRAIGDAKIVLGPQPARKWAGLGPAGAALSIVLASRGRRDLAAGAAILGALGSIFGLVGFRRPERALDVTARDAARSFGVGAAAGLLALLAFGRRASGE